MEPKTLKAFLRVLYTVNNNPQYILAKSSAHVPAIVCSEPTTQSATNESIYARAPLKACLAAVCDSSPELLQDPPRDFSLYVLDPLEVQPPPTNLAHTPHNTSSPRGVAVALGLMSWALESNDSNIFVTGTIIPNASPALEVIFALRETRRVPKPMLHAYPSLGPISATGSSQPLNPCHPRAAPQVQPDQQEQRTLTRSEDFPELYIGPPRRAPGRPEGSASSKSKVKSRCSTSSLPGNSSTELKQGTGRKSKQKTKPRPPRVPPTYSPFICEPLTRNTAAGPTGAGATGVPTSYQQSYPFSQNQTQLQAQIYHQHHPHPRPTQNLLLGLLPTISSTSSGSTGASSSSAPQAALLLALQELLAANPHLLQLAATNMGTSTTTGEQTIECKPMRTGSKVEDEGDDADSDIVILDSSTVDTTAFRKPSYRKPAPNDTDISPPATNQDSLMLSVQKIVPSPLPASIPPSGQEGTPASPQISTPTVTPEMKTPTSRHVSWEPLGERNTPSQAPDIPATPIPSQMRKRKLDQYIQGQAYSSVPSSPPSPSPSATRTSSTKRVLTARRVFSSPTRGTKSVSSSSARLPSMLGSMRSMAALATRPQVSSWGSSTHGRLASSLTNKNGALSTTPISGPSPSMVDHPEMKAAPCDVTVDAISLKPRLNLSLNEVMEEQEARKHAKVRKRPSSGRNLDGKIPASASQGGPPRASQLESTSRHAQSSPPRPLFRPVTPTSQPGLAPDAVLSNPPLATSAGTALSASTLTVAPAENPFKNFVMPAWARTSTAMLPRLSEEALSRQQAEQEAKKARMSLRRREAAKAKRKHLRDAERPSKESSDEDGNAIRNDPNPRPLHAPSSVARKAPLAPPPPPSLPVFASDGVAPISSPPQMHRQLPPVPSTPPRKPVSPASTLHRTPNKPGSCSLFTPSGQEPGSLFTPSTPSVTRSLTQTIFTPRSPTVLLRSGTRISPRKSVPQTPKRNGASLQRPRSLRSGRNPPFASPSLAMRMPQTGMGTRTFLLPPPSPCMSRTPRDENQMRSKVPGSVTPHVSEDSGIMKQESPDRQDIDQDKGSEAEDMPICEPDDSLLGTETSTPPVKCSPSRPFADDRQGANEPGDVGDEYASSPLPPSSPLPASPFSSPIKHRDSTNTLIVPDSDILLPSASDSDGPKGVMDTNWLSDNARTPTWLTDSEANAWFTETDAWLTDTEGGPLLTDSDGAWLSDSDAVFGDMSSFPLSSASNCFSDDADVDTDGEGGTGAIVGPDCAFDTAAFERAFAALVECGEQNGVGNDDAGTHGTKAVESEFWESIRPLLGENAVDSAGTTVGNVGESVDENKVAQDLQALLNGLVGYGR